MESILKLLQEHVFICTWIVALCALLTFLLNFVFKKKEKGRQEEKASQKISGIHNSSVNQAGGNITINGKENA